MDAENLVCMPVLADTIVNKECSRVLEMAEDLTTAYDFDLLVFYVLSQETFQVGRDFLLITPEYDEYSTSPAEEYAADLGAQKVADTIDARSTVRPLGLIESPTDEITSVGQIKDPDYVVRLKRTPTGKALCGSVTQSVLLSADRPVITVMSE
jgi:nucleotide-binding universal stress UspA family protein